MLLIVSGLIIGISLLLFATNSFVISATKLSTALKVSPLVIGVIFVAIGTSLPELVVSIFALGRGDAGLAFGNIIGSNIVNILLVLAIGIIVGNLHIGSFKTQRNGLVMIGCTFLFVLLNILNIPSVICAVILLSLVVGFVYLEYTWGVEGRLAEDANYITSENSKMGQRELFIFFLSIIGIFVGGVLIVNNVELFAAYSGLSTTILGLSLTAVATSLPELLTSIISERKGQDKIMVGNIIGSNIYNLLLIGGVIFLSDTKAMIKSLDWIILIVSALIGIGIIYRYKGQVVPKKIGVALLILCCVYFLTLGW